MPRNLAQIATEVTRLLPLSNEPVTIVGNADAQVRQLLALLQEDGDDLLERFEWNAVMRDFSFTVAADPHSATLPSDFNRFLARASMWRSGSRLVPLSGPVGPDQWQRLTTIPGTFPGYWRRFGGTLQVTGVAIGESVTIPYISQNWILGSDGVTRKGQWSADSDTPLIDDQLIILGGRWRWKASKGLDYAEDFALFERRTEARAAADRASRPVGTSLPADSDKALRNAVKVTP